MFVNRCKYATNIRDVITCRNSGANLRDHLFCNTRVERFDRFNLWLGRTYKSAPTLVVAAEGIFRDSTVRQWIKGDSEPSASNIVKLHELGLNALWYLTGDGPMFSDTPKGRALEQSVPLPEPGQSTSDPQSPDRSRSRCADRSPTYRCRARAQRCGLDR